MLGRIVAPLATAMMVASPCSAQMQDFNETGAFRPGASVGAYFRLPLTHEAGKPARAQVGLRVSAIRDHRDQWSPRAAVHQADALDLRLIGTTRPTLLVAGRPAADLPRQRLNLSTGATIAIVAGGAALLLLAAAASSVASFPGCPTIGGSRDHCID
jgi:hypothetical protein